MGKISGVSSKRNQRPTREPRRIIWEPMPHKVKVSLTYNLEEVRPEGNKPQHPSDHLRLRMRTKPAFESSAGLFQKTHVTQ
ncbi:hypothetical protein JTE90_026999 [Oedothorax gibbosus]|uniref:Uncharacterized protein n=1 Tax=Oedothorax gibbosus TaxID=931172 RepID=A0AAV6V976_9ARAC|nr:hypothetical protein JTE90_026999 [Oedothorax gibbosus]